MKAVWGYYESSSIQGKSNSNMVRAFNTLKRELTRQQDALFMDHQQEDVVSGGFANSIQFHYLLVPDTTPLASGIGVSNKALTSNIATLTTPTTHGFAVGQSVYVSNIDNTFNGTYTIATVPTTTTFTYTKVASNVSSAAATGSCVVAVGAFDANQGATGTASTYFETRRDFYEPGRGF